MFSHDPFQNYQTLGAYGAGIPYGLPYTGIQPNINPLALAAQQYPQQLQGQQYPQQLQGLNPLAGGLHNPQLQHPLAHAGWQNPLLNPILAYQQMLAQQMWQQPQSPFPYPLAPQSLLGGGQAGFGQPGIPQAGFGQPGFGQPGIPQAGYGPVGFGQINPLAQLALRQLAGY